MLLKDFEKSEEINHFSQESKDLIAEMGNMEIFEFYEDFFEETVSGLRLVLGNWSRKLYMRKMHAAYGRVDTSTKTDLTCCGFLDT